MLFSPFVSSCEMAAAGVFHKEQPYETIIATLKVFKL